MAESILKLRVDNQEYNAKIDRARQGLLAMEQACRKVGGTLEVVEKADLDFVKALGQMSTASNTANGKVSELTKAFTDLQSQYNRLTSEEKSSPFGKALAQSLDKLKGRIQDGNKELQDIQNQLRGTTKESDTSSTGLQALADKFGLNIGQMAKFATAGAAVAGALKVAKDAFMSSEQDVDNWGRTVKASEDLYSAFVSSLNNASLSSFFNNIDNIVKAAKEAYDALDNLQTKGGIISNKEARLNYQRQKQMAVINDKSKSEEERKAAQTQLTGLNGQMRDAKQATAALNQDVVNSKINDKLIGVGFKEGTKEYKEAFTKVMRSLYDENYKMGIVNTGYESGLVINNGNTRRRVDNGNRNLDNIITDEWRKDVNQYVQAAWSSMSQAEQEIRQGNRFAQKDIKGTGGSVTKTTTTTPKVDVTSSLTELQLLQDELKTVEASMSPFAKTSDDWKAMNEYAEGLRNKIKELNGELTEMQQGLSGPSTAAFSDWAKYLNDEMSTVDITTPLYQNLQAQLADTTAIQNIINTALENGISLDSINLDAEGLFDKILNAEDISNAYWQGITDAINEQLKALGIEPIQLNFETGGIKNLKKDAEQTVDNVEGIATAFNAVGNALNQIEDPGAKVSGYIATAIGQTAAAFGTAQIQAATMGPWAWIAFAATGLATMISTIQCIKSATAGSYADGGLIKGSSFTGDAVPIMANAGEIVLNYAQQSNIASALESKIEGGGGGRSTISGEQIVTVVNAYGRRTGRGEILR